MTMHSLPARRRAIGYLFPGMILVLAIVMFPPFIEAGRGWWPVFILAPAAAIAILVAMEWRHVAIGFDETGVRYQAVGYRVSVPWDRVKVLGSLDRPTLLVTEAESVASPWFAFLFRIGAILAPGHTLRASRMISSIPLYYFVVSGDDPVMRDFHNSAPEVLLPGSRAAQS